jgi:hypothetical protein
MTSRVLVAAALLCGCATGTNDNYWYDVSTDPSTETADALDTTVPDTVPDTSLDTGFDTPPDTELDPDVDPDPDPEPDPGCVSGTAGSGGTCNLIDRCGCTTGWCGWYIDTTTCAIYETCITATAGTIPHGMSCDPSSTTPVCAPGADCLSSDGGVTGTCQQWCRTDLDCPTGYTCTIPVIVGLSPPCSSETPMPYDACSI